MTALLYKQAVILPISKEKDSIEEGRVGFTVFMIWKENENGWSNRQTEKIRIRRETEAEA